MCLASLHTALKIKGCDHCIIYIQVGTAEVHSCFSITHYPFTISFHGTCPATASKWYAGPLNDPYSTQRLCMRTGCVNLTVPNPESSQVTVILLPTYYVSVPSHSKVNAASSLSWTFSTIYSGPKIVPSSTHDISTKMSPHPRQNTSMDQPSIEHMSFWWRSHYMSKQQNASCLVP